MMFGELYKQFCEQLSRDDFFDRHKVFPPAYRRRMVRSHLPAEATRHGMPRRVFLGFPSPLASTTRSASHLHEVWHPESPSGMWRCRVSAG